MAKQTDDAIEQLTEDHQKVKAMFEEFESLGERAHVSKKRLADKICAALTVHSQLEEELFYPAARANDELEELVDEALVEHDAAKDLISQIMEMEPEDALFDAKVKVLGEQIDHHVEEEEGQLFPKVRACDIDLEAIGSEMRERRQELEQEGASKPWPGTSRTGQSPSAGR